MTALADVLALILGGLHEALNRVQGRERLL